MILRVQILNMKINKMMVIKLIKMIVEFQLSNLEMIRKQKKKNLYLIFQIQIFLMKVKMISLKK